VHTNVTVSPSLLGFRPRLAVKTALCVSASPYRPFHIICHYGEDLLCAGQEFDILQISCYNQKDKGAHGINNSYLYCHIIGSIHDELSHRFIAAVTLLHEPPGAISMHTKEMGSSLSDPVGDQSSEIATTASDLLVTTGFVSSDC